MVEFITLINGTLVALKITRFEITFASRIIRPRIYISPSLIQYPVRAPHVQSASITKRITYRGASMCACRTPTHRHKYHTVRIVVEDEWHSEGRVDPFTIYSQRPMGFPSVSRTLSHSPTSGSLCEILERDGRRPCQGQDRRRGG